MNYPKSRRWCTPALMQKIMGPNPIKLTEELMEAEGRAIAAGSRVCDLGSGQGLTSAFLAQEYGLNVYAADLWSDPEENRAFFHSLGLTDGQITSVKADACALPFAPDFFDAVISVDSYNYFGRDASYLDERLLPFVRSGGEICLAIPGMRHDCHDALPEVLLRSWTPEQLEYMHDADWWTALLRQCRGAQLLSVREMDSNEEVWADWLAQDNEYARGDRASMEAGGGDWLNFLAIRLRKK